MLQIAIHFTFNSRYAMRSMCTTQSKGTITNVDQLDNNANFIILNCIIGILLAVIDIGHICNMKQYFTMMFMYAVYAMSDICF